MSSTKDPDARPFGTLQTMPEKGRRKVRGTPNSAGDDIPLPPGSMLGKYRIGRPLGSGGMGAVYEATHIEMGKAVALKVLNGALASDPRARARFLREAEAASKLEHRHVVNATDYGTESDVPYLVMELLRGEDLGGRLHDNPRGLAVEEAADIMLAVCAGVFAAHQAGVIHRDLKPRNIFLAKTKLREIEPKVLDFGISKVEDSLLNASLTDSGAVMGTMHYLSPEQVMGEEVDATTDQYALGVVLYECLTGRRPHEGDTLFVVMKSIREARFAPPSLLRRDLPREFEAVILRAMARERAARFPSVHALGSALLPFASMKRRVIWADYFGRDPLESSLPMGAARIMEGLATSPEPTMPAPAPPRLEWQSHDWGPFSTGPVPAAVRANTAFTRDQGGVPEPAGSLPAREIRSMHPRVWAFAVAGVITVCAASLVVLTRGGSRADVGSPHPLFVTRPLPAPPISSAQLAPEQPDPSRPQTGPGEVTIRVADAPPGLVAVADEKRMPVPLTLPRGAPAKRIVFNAPGYRSKEIFLDGRESKTIEIGLEAADQIGVASAQVAAVPIAAKTKWSKRPRTSSPHHDRPGPGQPGAITDIKDRDLPTPPPFTDL